MNKILILGRIPPPNGGVTVHVSRLLDALEQREPDYFEFIDFRKKPFKAFLQLLRYQVVHLHSSSPYLQVVVAFVCKLLGKKAMITFHGNMGRYGIRKNVAVKLAVRLSFIPVVLNAGSLQKAGKLNKRAIQISAFISSSICTELNPQLLEKLHRFRKKHEFLFCTNAWKLTFDKHGNETYGISGIIHNLEKTTQAGLIISDPSGSYKAYIQNIFGVIPGNVFIISGQHDFRNVLPFCDAFIRNTTTDGDSLSVHEAMEQHVIVFASDCVMRPAACRLFSDIEVVDFVGELRLSPSLKNAGSDHHEDAVETLLNLYKTHL
ncbi:glycosyltransferase [Dyadobacter sediminis]|uniref:Glycosyltransferase family 4 protein n=1 Tax=Dyadobacter sediminis TaxID=1493691 RepID=A0A5R9K790_9BACT|nr:glycosyltransferase [Dyadobacter sediminis]TLU89742.1 hypothetical protein FEM55_19585 [Dyadobacter sediminis]GGC13123.1 hypothetical protein GCM10011325_45050 [Dyadobacter sediminis]